MNSKKSSTGIHIKPSHEGDFTAKANAAGMGVQAYASKVLSAPEGQYDPSTRKQANFARNAAGWNHEMGGNMYATGGSFNNKGFMSLPKEVQNKIRSRAFADGGPMEAQLTEFSEGGRHEENPLGGIPQGTAPDGRVNLVEQGETKLNSENYIFSDSLKVDKATAEEFALPKNEVGKTFAEVSKKLNRPNSRRENDTIEQVAIQRDLDNLMNAQEAFKAQQVEQKIAEIQSLDPNALAQIAQSYQPQGMPPQGMEGAPGMEQGMPQGQPSPEEMAMTEQQGQMMDPAMQGQPPMDPAMMEQMQMQQGMAYGGPMSYKCGGSMYDFGGVMRNIGAGAYGIGEGMLDTLSMGYTDKLTDKGYDALSKVGNASAEELEQGKSVRGFGNTAGAVGGAVLNPASMGSAVSEGSEGLAAGVTNLEGTNEKFDKIANTIGQVGSIAGGFVGGNPTEASGAMAGSKGADVLMNFANNPLLKQATNMAGMIPQKYGGYQYANGGNLGMPMNYPTYKDNAGPMGQPLTNLYNMGGNMSNPYENSMSAFEFGGDLDFDNEDDFIDYLGEDTDTTRSFDNGGRFSPQYRDRFGNFTGGDNNYVPQTDAELMNNPFNKQSVEENLQFNLPTSDFDKMSPAEKEQYLSDLARAQEQLKNKQVDLSMNQTWGQAAGLALPAAYNIGRGLFGKVGTLNAKDYYQTADFEGQKYNMNPEKFAADQTFAGAANATRNAAPGGGAYMTNMQNLARLRNEAMMNINRTKQEREMASAQDAQIRNKAIEAANLGVKANVDDYNIKAREAKQQTLAAGLGQAAKIAENAVSNDIQTNYIKAVAPDFAGTVGYNTVIDQLLASRKASKEAKNNNNKTV